MDRQTDGIVLYVSKALIRCWQERGWYPLILTLPYNNKIQLNNSSPFIESSSVHFWSAMMLSQKSILSANQGSLVITSWSPISRYFCSSGLTGCQVIPAGEPGRVTLSQVPQPTLWLSSQLENLIRVGSQNIRMMTYSNVKPGGVGSPSLAKFAHMLVMAREVNQFNSDQLL